MTMVRETSAPWYIRQAEFDGIVIVLADIKADFCPLPGRLGHRYGVNYGYLTMLEDCLQCGYHHAYPDWFGQPTPSYRGDSLEEAEAAYAELERKLLAGAL